MDFRFTPEQGLLRREVCAFLEKELGTRHDSDPVPMPPSYLPAKEFERKLGEKGWLARSWPFQYGGGGRPIIEQFIVEEEVARHGGPASEALGRVIVAPILLACSSEEQKRRYLPQMARGEISFCLGYSEPGAGSDLVSLQTRAVAQGDDYAISGRKVFTSGAEASEYCWLAARTDPTAPKHSGISVFIVPMDSPGVEVRPLINLLDKHWFNEVIFDNVRVPRANRVGEENRGWEILTSALGVERITLYRAPIHLRVLKGLLRFAKAKRDRRALFPDPRLRRGLAQLAVEFEVARLLLYRAVGIFERGEDCRAQAAMVKLFNTELAQRLYQTAVAVLGPYGTLREGSKYAPWLGAIAHGYLSAVQDTIGAGTSEVQRDIIARRGLGLPGA